MVFQWNMVGNYPELYIQGRLMIQMFYEITTAFCCFLFMTCVLLAPVSLGA